MLDATTKAKIDSARDILVGKVPDPKSQVEQITIALIYKFMDDMDRQSEELGGKATFFTGEFKKYRWAQLLDKRYSGHERLLLYAEGMEKMNENKNIPQLFRDIFKGVFLPYRDPETLNLFLKEIDGFSYDHSERLGDAFEYLLSILGTQGEAGQFRTPRHIIDFIVAVVDPKKNETILDPACGTAGFLISAYKHILKANENLSPDERSRLMTNFRGYDIAPDMVRLARANLYLHGFPNPTIHEYDTLTSEERWDERCEVILANPPFMTPKGGIRPHNRFAVKSRKSEVLFVDYIVEHLNVGGRAGVIVPDGIVANPQSMFVRLRKLLIENGLYAVVSLHNSVFLPYAVAKTSILFIDRSLVNRRRKILFATVANDGYDLGQQRRPIESNDLPEIALACREFRDEILRGGAAFVAPSCAAAVELDDLAAGHDLFANRYVAAKGRSNDGYRPIGSLFNIEKGCLQSSKNRPGKYPFITAAETWSTHDHFTHDCEALVFAMAASGSLGRTHYVKGQFIASDLCFILTPKDEYRERLNLRFYHAYFNAIRAHVVKSMAKGGAKLSINKTDFAAFPIVFLPKSNQDALGAKILKEATRIESLKREIQDAESKICELVASLVAHENGASQ